MKKLLMMLTALALLTAGLAAAEGLNLDSLMTEIDAADMQSKAVSMGELSFEVSADRQSIYIDRPTVSGAANYTIAYNIYDSDSNPVNYFYSTEARVAATPGYGGLFNVFVVVTDTLTNEAVTKNIGWQTLAWPYAETLSVGSAAYALSPDKKSIYVDRPEIACRSGSVTIAYNIYDDEGKPVNYFYSTQKRVAATPGYEGKFNVFIVVTDTGTGEQDVQDIGWQVLGNQTQPEEPDRSDFTYTVNGWDVTITGYTGTSPNVVIPDKITAKPVTAIGDDAFSGHTAITSVRMPNTIKSIGKRAFSGCTSLSDIVLSSSVQSIGSSCFTGCTSLPAITIPDSVTELGQYAFSGCVALQTASLGIQIREIKDSTFVDCKSLKKIMLPEGLELLGESAFCYCTQLQSVTIPTGVAEIGTYAFRGCTALKAVTIVDGVGGIGQGAFLDCDALSSIFIPGSCEVIGKGAFQRCSKLLYVKLQEGVLAIDDSVFVDCDDLTAVHIPPSVQSIGESVFLRCYNVKIYGTAGSFAQFWAQNNHITFVAE